jgi:hypothetical protein
VVSPTIYLVDDASDSNTTGAPSRTGIKYSSGTPECIPVFCGVRVAQSLVFSVVFCRSLTTGDENESNTEIVEDITRRN